MAGEKCISVDIQRPFPIGKGVPLPESSIFAPANGANGRLEDKPFLLDSAYFQGRTVSFSERGDVQITNSQSDIKCP